MNSGAESYSSIVVFPEKKTVAVFQIIEYIQEMLSTKFSTLSSKGLINYEKLRIMFWRQASKELFIPKVADFAKTISWSVWLVQSLLRREGL